MLNKKRLTISTLCGLAFGFVCLGLASRSGNLPTPVAYQILAERTLIGFAIGISVLRLGHWSVHGLVLGLILSLPLAFSGMMAPENPQFTRTTMFIMTVLLGMIYGLLTELITTKFFNAGQARSLAVQPA